MLRFFVIAPHPQRDLGGRQEENQTGSRGDTAVLVALCAPCWQRGPVPSRAAPHPFEASQLSALAQLYRPQRASLETWVTPQPWGGDRPGAMPRGRSGHGMAQTRGGREGGILLFVWFCLLFFFVFFFSFLSLESFKFIVMIVFI